MEGLPSDAHTVAHDLPERKGAGMKKPQLVGWGRGAAGWEAGSGVETDVFVDLRVGRLGAERLALIRNLLVD